MRLKWFGLFASLYFSLSCAGATTNPTTQPEPLERVAHISPISLQTKGHTPKEAFMMLEKATGVTIRASRGETLDGELNYNIGLDLQSASFWRAMDDFMLAAGLEVRYVGDQHVLLGLRTGPAQYSRGSFGPPILPGTKEVRMPNFDPICDTPAARITAAPFLGQHMVIRSDNEAPEVHDTPNGVKMTFRIDPRVRLYSVGQPVFEAARDERGGEVHLDALTMPEAEINRREWSFIAGPRKGLPPYSDVKDVHGYLPVWIVTDSQSVELTVQAGVVKRAGPWEIRVLDIGIGGSAPANLDGKIVFLGLEPINASHPPRPPDLTPLLRLVNQNNEQLVPDVYATTQRVEQTTTGGVRQHFSLSWKRGDTDRATAKLIMEIPLEVKEAAIPFEFKSVPLP